MRAYRRFLSGIVYRGYRLLFPRVPYYTPGAIVYLRKALECEDGKRLFEWGSGKSTLWFASRVDLLVAIEHNLEWHEWVSQRLSRESPVSAECRYIPPMSDSQMDGFSWERDWAHYETLGHAPSRPTYHNYMAAIDEFADEYFDVVCIDGRERVGCAVHAAPKVRRGGIMVLDDSNRPKYAEIFALQDEWETIRYPFGLRETALLIKPKECSS
jgi:hypothetical protein